MVQVSLQGFTPTSMVTFMHTSNDCSGPRLLVNLNGPAFAFYGVVIGNSVVYTRAVDPTGSAAVSLESMEIVTSAAELASGGSCSPTPGFVQSAGPAVIAVDPGIATLTTPFSVQ